MPLPVIIDIEASGFGRGSYPIEVAHAMPDGQACCSLCRLADAVHGIDGASRQCAAPAH